MLTTDRLLLQPFVVEDAPFILELLNMPAWLEFIGDRGVRTLQDAENYIVEKYQATYEQLGYGAYRVSLKESGQPIGMCSLFKRDMLDAPDIGFAFLPDYTGNGYGYESASALMNYARQTLGMPRILGFTSPLNQSSIQLLKKIGMQFEGKILYKDDGEESLLFGTPALDS